MLHIKKRKQGIHRPMVCTPLVGKTTEELQVELQKVVLKKPDLIEWRIDFFSAIGETATVIQTGAWIKAHANGIPILFTRRSIREGGEAIELSEEAVCALYEAMMGAGDIDLIDIELSCPEELKTQLLTSAQKTGKQTILSFHHFSETPSEEAIIAKLKEAELTGGDVGKVAVMPHSVADVLTLIQATQKANELLSIPVVTMSMGEVGALSRLIGGACGSAVTFAIGSDSSAPGQIPIEELNQVLNVIDRSQSKKTTS
ncbi:3-dehydroquinate dehydratase-1 [Alkalihalobacillus xiaoxiensis]|uniref:3-dehydroquinate dehydratase n=1 Tax=Shouchella xiaoxiensis TaxID=766895 RepID=A0ABS2SP39_9BACI|nr:type I 3-dehydroquinate dehydratase [Shouchella xiaoxiensis]MBM7837293.1 3-dehydroquinate dehydratase-1 [Shouchella xiaoxiensis]